ncbi:MAG: type II toxin-antitoxin system RelB/DinJ family antitoxin [Lachnospiraceae bacterium]|nr:type II toxin-antitoxin system RelB/DinJ family antitoxin [Lachnospiraceae bacterium]
MVQVNLRVDEEVKRRAEIACKNMGMNMSTAINIFLVKMGNEQRIPFEVSADPFYSAENMTELKKRADDAKAGRNMHEHELIEED